MNICKSLKSIFPGRRLLFLLTALMLASGLITGQAPKAALAMPPIPPEGEGDEIEGPPPEYFPPENGFAWSVSPRYGLNETDDGLMDTYWNASTFSYDPAYIYPDYWPMQFFGCQTGPDAEYGASTTNAYEWNIAGVTINDGRCFFTYNGFTQQGTYPVTLTYTPQNGTAVSFSQTVYIHDYFIVAIGDSLASGEGNPDVRQQVVPVDPIFGLWIPGSPARWQDQRCHRSAYAYPSKAAIELEYSDPHTSVTFISFACSGATILTPTWDPYFPILNNDPDPSKYRGTGILGPYVGNDWSDYDVSTFIPSQIVQLQTALNPPAGKAPRRFDALVISAGGNDFHFGDISAKCLADDSCWPNSMVFEYVGTQYNLQYLVNRALTPSANGGSPSSLPDSFAALNNHIAGNDQIPGLNPQPAAVYITQYADQTRANTYGTYCKVLDDIFTPLTYAVTPQEAQLLTTNALPGLNQAIQDAAELYGWQYVDGLTTYVDPVTGESTPGEFVLGPDGKGHGYCASDNWIVRADEAEKIQGPGPFLRFLTKGTLHPNLKGIQVIKDRLLYYLRPDLEATLPGNPTGAPPTFSASFTSGELTSRPGANGWFTHSCDSSDNCSDQVVLQVTATGSSPLESASVNVNDQVGCSAAGVTCPRTVTTSTEVSWDLAFTADGIYQMQFSARDSNGRIAVYDFEIKVDLNDPEFRSIGPYEVDEGSSITLTAQASDTTSAILNYGWDLDNDGIYEAPDEQPAFSAAALDGPDSKTVGVLVIDEAGRSATATTTINVLNVAPTVTINGAPATSPEGTAIALTSSVTDVAAADTSFTYAWSVEKDGSNYTTGAGANFSFTPDDNGSYKVSLSVTDDDGSTGTASQTFDVTNVTPALSNVSVPASGVYEGASFTLSGDITEPGTADTLSLTIDWGDGSTPETVSLAAGSTGFSRSHTYADDNPTGTSSDTYNVSLSLADDDGGKGTGSASVVVNNQAPSLSISAPENGTLYAVNATVNLSASLTDPSSFDTLTCSVNWANGVTTAGTVTAGVCTASRAYSVAGVYTIQMTASDDDTGAKNESVMVVVYDPRAGFVTGGGWILSPIGAYKLDESLTGKATFGFVSKYLKGANVPTGNTAFEFGMAGMAFSSTSYEWLVVNQGGTNAQFKGSGTVNGALDPNGNAYKFMLWAGDGSPDTFRIRIWWEDAAGEHDVYDNGVAQVIGGGNIVVHTGK